MAQHYLHRYVVESSFPFPVDMLRHDGAFPVDGNSSASVVDSIATGGVPPQPRRVELAAVKHTPDWAPEAQRWRSFLWTVLPFSHNVTRV